MHISPSALGLDAALEAPIVAIVRNILDLQIVNAAFRMKVQSAKWKENKPSFSSTAFHTQFVNANQVFYITLSLNFSFNLYKYLGRGHYNILRIPLPPSPLPPPPLQPHVTNCANIEFSAVGGAAATLQGPAGGSTLNVSRNINKYVMLIFAQSWARGVWGGMEGRVTAT